MFFTEYEASSYKRSYHFDRDEKEVRRAGLNIQHLVDLTVWESFEDFVKANPNGTFILPQQNAKIDISDVKYEENDFIIFGP